MPAWMSSGWLRKSPRHPDNDFDCLCVARIDTVIIGPNCSNSPPRVLPWATLSRRSATQKGLYFMSPVGTTAHSPGVKPWAG